MLATIDNVLDRGAITHLRQVMADGEFVDGQKTAGFRAKRVKHNEQLSPDGSLRKELDAMVVDALRRNA
jgi:PKHD-type hydroxylase